MFARPMILPPRLSSPDVTHSGFVGVRVAVLVLCEEVRVFLLM
jgi:hypothetical protein